ncbi:MAG: heavy metal response regulator transcription factor [Pseudomonas sp.]|uniref:heavy metal response regulator transcription factor n=1 Tax=Pseudomonas sp. TaxID=306 RepID=UPI003391F835
MKLLIAEDEITTGTYLQQGLSEAGFTVERVTDGRAALQHALSDQYDLLILDVLMPGMQGWEVLSGIRSAGLTLPVLFLTARDGVADRVKGLELGADDYLIKPFAFSELLARVRTLLRRGTAAAQATRLSLADLHIDLLTRRATRAGQRIELTAKEFALLEFFMRRRGEVLPKSLIAAQVWDLHFDSETNVIEVAVRRLRTKIDEGFAPKLIHTARGLGYRFDSEANP